MKTTRKSATPTPAAASPQNLAVSKPQHEIDSLDETIRMLNEALSHALDELNALREAA